MTVWETEAFWGNEAAEDEALATLDSYFVTKPDFAQFFSPDKALQIVRAKKGMGKSALLCETSYRARNRGNDLVVMLTGSDLRGAQPYTKLTADGHVHDWLQRICLCINKELGRTMQLALSDDAWALVDQAEMTGFRERNFLGALLARLKLKIKTVELQQVMPADQFALSQRILNEDDGRVWLIVDDIDATFVDHEDERLRISTFFTALRTIAREFQGACVRTSVRTDVWSLIHSSDQALDKVHQYISDLHWSNREMGEILRERVVSYCNRTNTLAPPDEPLDMVFPRRYPWGRRRVPPSDVLHRYAGGRPRWALRLCKMAAQEAARTQAEKIAFGHIKKCMQRYGRERRADLASEYRFVCSELNQIINAFAARRSKSFTTSELKEFIGTQILPHSQPTIDNVAAQDPLAIARLLFRVGFLLGRDEQSTRPEFYRFEEKPDVLSSDINPDDGMSWEIHPAFHATLGVQ